MKKLIFLLLFLCFHLTMDAQNLKKIADKAKQKADNIINEQVDKSIDKTVNPSTEKTDKPETEKKTESLLIFLLSNVSSSALYASLGRLLKYKVTPNKFVFFNFFVATSSPSANLR